MLVKFLLVALLLICYTNLFGGELGTLMDWAISIFLLILALYFQKNPIDEHGIIFYLLLFLAILVKLSNFAGRI